MTQTTLTVDLGERSYPIHIGPGLLQKLGEMLPQLGLDNRRKVLVITDEKVGPLYLDEVLASLLDHGYQAFSYAVPAGEQAKSLNHYEAVISYALEQRLDRQSAILALGGGVVGDLAGFVAGTFMRGIPFVQLPTTVLAHDSSVGGKVAINHPLGKNMIGSFYQPLAVIYDTSALSTLPEREVSAGFAEVLKHAFIWDAPFAEWLMTHAASCLALEEPYLSQALARAAGVKAQVVSRDEKEEGLRAILNYGHTFGHAFEALGNYNTLQHGEAISIGMVLAARLSERVYGISGLSSKIKELLTAYRLPTDWQTLPWQFEDVLKKMYVDKKVQQGRLRFVLLKKLGEAVVTDEVDESLIKEIWQETL